MAAAPAPPPQRRLPLEVRLSPRCNLNGRQPPPRLGGSGNNTLLSCSSSSTSSLVRGCGSSSAFSSSLGGHSRQSSSALSSSSSSLLFPHHHHRVPPLLHPGEPFPVPPPPNLHHSRQSSSASSGSGSGRPRRPPPPPPPPSSGAAATSSRPRPPPPPRCSVRKHSPTSLDMGYHTMANNGLESDADNEDSHSSPFTSLDVSPVSVDHRNLSASYTNNSSSDRKIKESSSPFDLLSDDLLLRILSHLPADSLCSTATACRRLYFLAWDPRLWERVRLGPSRSLNADRALDGLLSAVGRHCGAGHLPVRRLDVAGCTGLSDAGVSTAASRCGPSLERVDLRGCVGLRGEGVFSSEGLAGRCPNLEHMELAGEQNRFFIIREKKNLFPIRFLFEPTARTILAFLACVALGGFGIRPSAFPPFRWRRRSSNARERDKRGKGRANPRLPHPYMLVRNSPISGNSPNRSFLEHERSVCSRSRRQACPI